MPDGIRISCEQPAGWQSCQPTVTIYERVTMSCKKCADKEAAVKQAEQERILRLLSGFQNPIWRRNYLRAIKKLIESDN